MGQRNKFMKIFKEDDSISSWGWVNMNERLIGTYWDYSV